MVRLQWHWKQAAEKQPMTQPINLTPEQKAALAIDPAHLPLPRHSGVSARRLLTKPELDRLLMNWGRDGMSFSRERSVVDFIREHAQSRPAAIAVQDGNLADKNPKTGKVVTVDELYHFATEELHVNYIFWGTEEPYYSRDVLPYLWRSAEKQRR